MPNRLSLKLQRSATPSFWPGVMVACVVSMVIALTTQADTNVLPNSTSQPIVPPLTTSPNTQYKGGSLLIGDGNDSLCLNNSCITSWSTITDQLPDYVRIRQTAFSTQPDTGRANYVAANDLSLLKSQANDASVKSKYTNNGNYQAYAAVIKAPTVNVCRADVSAGAYFCNGDSRFAQCNTNSDCFVTSKAVVAIAVGTSLAADFHGTVLIRPAVTPPSTWTGSADGRLCLNGFEGPYSSSSAFNVNPPDQTGPPCISSWNELTSGVAPLYLKRQLTSPFTAQTPGAAISQYAQFAGSIIGDPGAIPVKYTCGDGICNGIETSTSTSPNYCAVDCLAIGTPAVTTAVGIASYSSPTVTVQATIDSHFGDTNVLIVRSTSATPTFKPINGYTYTTGQTFGNEKVVYAGTKAKNAVASIVSANDTIPIGVAPRPTYYYSVYEGNGFPSYGAPATTTVKLGVATVILSVPDGATVGPADGSGQQYACSGANCFGLYNIANGAVVTTIGPVTLNGYDPNGWSSCDSSTISTCTFSLSTTDRQFTFNLTAAGGGGGGGGGGEIFPP